MRRYEGSISTKRLGVGAALVALTLLTCTASAISAGGPDPGKRGLGGGLDPREIKPGQTIGYARLGMTRNTIEHKLKSLSAPDRSQDHQHKLYSLTYRYRYNHTNCNGGKLIVVFHGLSPGAHAVYMLTRELCLTTNDAGVGVFDTLEKLLASYSVACYHSNLDGSRDPIIDDFENSECELHSNGGFTYFSFASVDADPEQRIGAIAIATRQVD